MKHIFKFGNRHSLLLLPFFLLFISIDLNGQCTTTRSSTVSRPCNVLADTVHLPIPMEFTCPVMGQNVGSITLVLPTHIIMTTGMPCDSACFSKMIRTWDLEIKNAGNVTLRHESYNDTICFTKIALFANMAMLDTVVCPRDSVIFCSSVAMVDTSIAALGSPLNGSVPCNILQSAPISIIWIDKSPGCFKFTREWHLLDWCPPVKQKTCIQTIEVRDTVKPVISTMSLPISDKSISGDVCTASFVVPPIVASDNCTAASKLKYKVTINGVTINTNGGIISGISIGTHDVVYEVNDGCDNISTFTTTVKVYDGVGPLAFCKGSKIVQIPSSGMVTLPKTAFDDGSFDRCSPFVSIKVKRMLDLPSCRVPGNPFNHFDDNVKFCCADAGIEVMVIMRVYQALLPAGPESIDGAFNLNAPHTDCMTSVKVLDKVGPDITCPSNVTIDCRDIGLKSVKNMSAYGAPTISDMCLDSIKIDSISHLDACLKGYIVRKISAKDKAGNISSCEQLIYTKNDNLFNAFDTSDFVFPRDTTFFICSASTTTAVTGLPQIKDPSCAKIAYDYKDEVYSFATGACKKILRKWSVVDWCQVDPMNSYSGKWSRTQLIVVMDTAKPVLIVPANFIVNNMSVDCSPTAVSIPKDSAYDCTPFGSLDFTYITDLYSDGIDLVTSSGRDASQSLPNGIHTIEFRVSDGCGNTTSKKTVITVRDGKKPTPVVMHGIATDLSIMNGVGMVRIFARQFFLPGSAYDNCTPFAKLKFSFSANVNDTVRTYTCDSIGTRNVRLVLTDEAGNQDIVNTYVLIQNNMNACTSPSPDPAPDPLPALRTAGIEGKMVTESGKEIDQVSVKIMNGSTAIPDPIVYPGKFIANELLMGQSYDITPKKEINPSNGVSTVDLIIMQKHILGLKLLSSPYKIIAADIDRNKEINAADLVELRKLILGIDSKFSKNDSWRFVDANYVFKDINNALNEPFKEVFSVKDMDHSMEANFIGVKVGDVNESGVASDFSSLEIRRNQYTSIALSDRFVLKGEEIKMDIKSTDFESISGLQLGLKLGSFKFIGIEPGQFHANEIFSNIDYGSIRLSIASSGKKASSNETLFSIILVATENKRLSESISLLPEKEYSSEMYDEKLNVATLDLKWKTSNQDFQLFQNRPNPFEAFTIVNYTLPQSSPITLKVIDLNGRIIYTSKVTGIKGLNEWRINRETFRSSGIYYYRIESPFGTDAHKMILIR
ncbi:MAG: T9SS type A sorting domain-containing protein [Saprospiraceae bacterium]